jgi:NAD(P)-dependent dehydrogenase (short-subunit alcohol dehydrogenase family)
MIGAQERTAGMDLDFRGEVVAVSAAGSGLGRSIAQAFARRGARVFACDVSPGGLAATAEVPGIETAVVDLADRAAAAAWVADVEAGSGGAIGVLVNNAGGSMGQIPDRWSWWATRIGTASSRSTSTRPSPSAAPRFRR